MSPFYICYAFFINAETNNKNMYFEPFTSRYRHAYPLLSFPMIASLLLIFYPTLEFAKETLYRTLGPVVFKLDEFPQNSSNSGEHSHSSKTSLGALTPEPCSTWCTEKVLNLASLSLYALVHHYWSNNSVPET